MNTAHGLAAGGGRDLRLDFFRGFALFCIFIDHTPNDLLSWFTVGSVGVSDAAEVFVLVSGYTAAVVYGRAFDREGALWGTARIGRRIWQLYVAHVFLFVLFLAIVGRTPEVLFSSHYVDEFRVGQFLEDPALALVRVLTLQFQPVFMGILPLYIVLLALLPAALWGFARAPAAVLGLSAVLWLAVQIRALAELSDYALPERIWPFNPLAWQALFVFGAYLGWRGMGGRIGWLRSRWLAVAAAVIAVAGFVIQMDAVLHDWYGIATLSLAKTLEPYMSKTDLSALRFANVMALALLAVRLLPPDARFLNGRLAWPFIVCGRHSLQIFCLGILLSVLAYLLVSEYAGERAMQIVVSAAGVLAMVGYAALLDGFGSGRGRSRGRVPAGE